MKIFAAGLQAETNTFAPRLTDEAAFAEGGVYRSAEVLSGAAPENAVARTWRDLAQRDGHVFSNSLFALAHPSGPTIQSVYEKFRDEILRDLRASGPTDLVLLYLHGAMVTDQGRSCEIDLVQHVRAATGPNAIIGVELDPHCHLSQDLIDACDVVVLMKEYPHDDYVERAEELYAICVAARNGTVRPATALFDCRMVGFYRTSLEPMAGFVALMKQAEREPGILSVSFAHGFPWGDMPDAGSRVLVVADEDAALAGACAERIGRAVYDMRQALLPRFPSIDEALSEAISTPGLVVLADLGDNPGGGAPSDNVTLLHAMLERGIDNAAVGAICDPDVARLCIEAGVGATIGLRLGGKNGAASGDPIDVIGVVRACKEDHVQVGLGNSISNLGPSTWIDVGGNAVIITTVRTQVFDPALFTGLGVDLAQRKMVAVKSSQHFFNRFNPIASKVLWVSTPGALDMDFARLPYARKRDLAYFPRVDAPLG